MKVMGSRFAMNIRKRKLIGAISLIVLLIVYSLAAMRFAVAYILDQHAVVHAIYFILAGVAWMPPAVMLVKWMQKP